VTPRRAILRTLRSCGSRHWTGRFARDKTATQSH
jgi:hypothetical protein